MNYQTSYLPIAFKENFEKHPEILDISNLDTVIAGVVAKTQVSDAIAAANRTNKGELEAEYNRLRGDLFKLQEEARSGETKVNNAAGKVRHHQDRLAKLKQLSKEAYDAGLPLRERAYNHQITLEEGYLCDAMDELRRAKKDNHAAVKALRAFNTARLDELKGEIAEKAKVEPAPVAKEQEADFNAQLVASRQPRSTRQVW